MLWLLARPDAILNSFTGHSVNTPHNRTVCFFFSFSACLLYFYWFVYFSLISNFASSFFFANTQLHFSLFHWRFSFLAFISFNCFYLYFWFIYYFGSFFSLYFDRTAFREREKGHGLEWNSASVGGDERSTRWATEQLHSLFFLSFFSLLFPNPSW